MELFDKGGIGGVFGHFAGALVLDEDEEPVGEVAVFAEKLGVAAALKIFPGKFRILVFRSIGSDCIADLISGKLGEEIGRDRSSSLPIC